MALIYKRNSGTDLSLTTSWSDTSATGAAAAAIPTGSDTVQFDTASLGGTYTNALTCSGITFNSASAAVTFSGTTTLGTGGWTNAVTNNLNSIFSGTLAVGTNNQTWTIYKTTANTTGLQINAGFTGSATVTLATAGANKAFFSSVSTTATFTGTLKLGDNTVYNTNNTSGTGSGSGIGNGATIQIDGTGSGLSASTATGTFVSAVVANNSWAIGVGTILQAVNITGTTTFGSGGAYTLTTNAVGTLTGAVSMSANSHTISTVAACTVAGALTLANSPYKNTFDASAATLTISGQMTGTNGFNKTGSAQLLITNVTNTVSGTVDVSAGMLRLGTVSQSGNTLPSVTAFTISSTSAELSPVSNAAYTFSAAITGSGNAYFQNSNASGTTLANGVLGGLTNASSTIGAGVYANATTSYLNVNDFPEKFVFYMIGASPVANTFYVNPTATLTSAATSLDVTGAITGTATAALYNNNANANHTLTMNGAVTRVGTGTINYVLRGTNTGNNEIGGAISGTQNVIKNDAGKWILSGTNTYTGTTTLTAGTLTCSNNAALGANTAAVTLTAGTLQITGGYTLDKTGATITNNGATIQSTGTGSAVVDASAISMGASFTVIASSNCNLSFSSTTPITGGATTRTLTITGPNYVYLYGTSTYVGPTTITSGTVVVQTLTDAGTSGGLGAPASAQATITVSGTGVTLWVLSTGSTNRSINVTGNSATLSLYASDDFTYSTGATITFAGTGSNTLYLSSLTAGKTLTIDRTVADGANPTLLYASSSGTVRLTGSLTYTGQTTVASGTLDFGAASRTLTGILYVGAPTNTPNVIIDNGFTVSANTTLVNNGKVSAVLTGAKTLTVNSAATTSEPAILQPDATTTGSNTFTGNATIGGVVDLITPNAVNVATATYGRVLGNSNTVTVSTGGAIRTKTLPYSNQRGRARYNNLTFSSGSALYIGGAA